MTSQEGRLVFTVRFVHHTFERSISDVFVIKEKSLRIIWNIKYNIWLLSFIYFFFLFFFNGGKGSNLYTYSRFYISNISVIKHFRRKRRGRSVLGSKDLNYKHIGKVALAVVELFNINRCFYGLRLPNTKERKTILTFVRLWAFIWYQNYRDWLPGRGEQLRHTDRWTDG